MRDKPKVNKQIREERDYFLILVGYARSILQIAVGVFVIALAYLLYGMYSGSLNASTLDPRILGNLRMMGQVLTLASLVAAACFVVLTLEDFVYSVLMALVGCGLMFGMPILAASALPAPQNGSFAVISEGVRTAGMAILAIVGFRVVYEIVQQIRTATEKRGLEEEQEAAATGIKKVKRLPRQGIWSPCWKLPYCHDAVRELCPAYKARRACWRFGYGCNCDPGLIESLIRSGALETGKGGRATNRDKTVANAYLRSDLQADAPIIGRVRTIPCSKCPIYMDHQRQKFRIVNPIAIIAALALMFAAYKPLTAIYTTIIRAAAGMASRLSYGTTVDAGTWFGYLNTSGVKIFFFIIVGLLALAYVLKFVEWVIFEKKL